MEAHTHRICSIVFIGDGRGRVLLQHRAKRPNFGLWTNVGGKLKGEEGESPAGCALRELQEETGVQASLADLELFGVVSENNYEGGDNWLMFLFRLLKPVSELPPACAEGVHAFHPVAELARLPLPPVDRSCLWPLFLDRRPGVTMIRIDCAGGNEGEPIIEHGPALQPLGDILARLEQGKKPVQGQGSAPDAP